MALTMDTASNCNEIMAGMESWRLLPISAITSTKTRVGLLPVSKSTFLNLVKRGLAPAGKQLFGRTRFWALGEIQKFSENFEGGQKENE